MEMADQDVVSYGWTNDRKGFCYVILPVMKIMRRYFPNTNEVRVLDVGSGNGDLCGELNRAGYCVTGMEVDDAGCALARKRFPGISFHQLGVYDDPDIVKNNGLFDCVVSTEVIEHLFRPQFLPRFASSVLRKNGILIISTPYHGYFKNLIWSLFNHWDVHHAALWDGGHIKFFSRRTLTELLVSMGFEVIEFKGVRRLPLLWSSMILVAIKRTPVC